MHFFHFHSAVFARCFSQDAAGWSLESRPHSLRVLAPFFPGPSADKDRFSLSHGVPTRASVWDALNGSGVGDLLHGVRRRDLWRAMASCVITLRAHALLN